MTRGEFWLSVAITCLGGVAAGLVVEIFDLKGDSIVLTFSVGVVVVVLLVSRIDDRARDRRGERIPRRRSRAG